MFGSTGARISLYMLLAWFTVGFLGLVQQFGHNHYSVGLLGGSLGWATGAGIVAFAMVEATEVHYKVILEPVFLLAVVVTVAGYYRGGGVWAGCGSVLLGAILMAVFFGTRAEDKKIARIKAARAAEAAAAEGGDES